LEIIDTPLTKKEYDVLVDVSAGLTNREIAEIGFFAEDALPEGTTKATRRRIDEIRGRAAPVRIW